jgi:hypothetical protein
MIPEVPEEASSANITPRRMEEEKEEIARMMENNFKSPLFGTRKHSEEKYENERSLILDADPNVITKFNIDKELVLPKDGDINISILSSLDNSKNDDFIFGQNEEDLSTSNFSFTSGNFDNPTNISNR